MFAGYDMLSHLYALVAYPRNQRRQEQAGMAA